MYGRKCESVASYITLLNSSSLFEEFREIRLKQSIVGEVNINDLVETLRAYAIDPFYTYKVRDTVKYLYREYPSIFKVGLGI